ncbi:unnamed protein product [Pseudo-nitzschia multistriata]|uniref:Uncharacterized protein n=1 Tax=Pseudo-nitzschia multistriata TaxID=183589 RepID=A0A448YV91_9STRA|nr:unnamed protein product [Pseudo-nitzschia multistriata]
MATINPAADKTAPTWPWDKPIPPASFGTIIKSGKASSQQEIANEKDQYASRWYRADLLLFQSSTKLDQRFGIVAVLVDTEPAGRAEHGYPAQNRTAEVRQKIGTGTVPAQFRFGLQSKYNPQKAWIRQEPTHNGTERRAPPHDREHKCLGISLSGFIFGQDTVLTNAPGTGRPLSHRIVLEVDGGSLHAAANAIGKSLDKSCHEGPGKGRGTTHPQRGQARQQEGSNQGTLPSQKIPDELPRKKSHKAAEGEGCAEHPGIDPNIGQRDITAIVVDECHCHVPRIRKEAKQEEGMRSGCQAQRECRFCQMSAR